MENLSDVMVITGTNVDEFQAEAQELKTQGYVSKHYDSLFNCGTGNWHMIAVYEKESVKPSLCDTCGMFAICDISGNEVNKCGSYFANRESEASTDGLNSDKERR